MKPWRAFDLVETALRPGTTLIEASAGTGKTFTIAGLFLRLILERELSAREILVVTFTEAATEELRDRIRQTLASARLAGGRLRGSTATRFYGLEHFQQGPAASPVIYAYVPLGR